MALRALSKEEMAEHKKAVCMEAYKAKSEKAGVCGPRNRTAVAALMWYSLIQKLEVAPLSFWMGTALPASGKASWQQVKAELETQGLY